MPSGVYKRTKEFSDKMRILSTGRKFSGDSKKKMRDSHLGHVVKKETREKISLSMKGKMPKYIPSAKGIRYKITKESAEKRKANGHGKWMEGRFGDKSNGWKGGISIGENRKEYYRAKHRERRVKKLMCGGNHTVGEWETLKAQYNWTCPCCKKQEPQIKLTEDHIIPVSKGGSDNIENIQPLCQRCNSKKSSKTIKY